MRSITASARYPSETRGKPRIFPPEARGVPTLRALDGDAQHLAVALAEGLGPAEAARRAGISPGRAGRRARELSSLPAVRLAVRDLARALCATRPSPGATLTLLRCALADSDVPDPAIARIVAQADGLLSGPPQAPPLDPVAIAAAVRAALREDDDRTDSADTHTTDAPPTPATPTARTAARGRGGNRRATTPPSPTPGIGPATRRRR